jgi:hypothetical protein
VFKISPTRNQVLEEFAVYLKNCSCCNASIIEILRVDEQRNILKAVRLKPKNVVNFFEKVTVLEKTTRKIFRSSKISKFILNYNEFGKIKGCAKNLSSLNIGRVETNPIANLEAYKLYQERGKQNCFFK